jgi:hypothetical protein
VTTIAGIGDDARERDAELADDRRDEGATGRQIVGWREIRQNQAECARNKQSALSVPVHTIIAEPHIKMRY